MIHSIYCRLYIVSFCGFLCTYRKTCSLCIGTFGANIVIIDVVNFIVDVTSLQSSSVDTTRPGRMFGMLSGMYAVRRERQEALRYRDTGPLIRGDGISVVSCLLWLDARTFFLISGRSRNACDTSRPWLHADKDFIPQRDLRHTAWSQLWRENRTIAMGTQTSRWLFRYSI